MKSSVDSLGTAMSAAVVTVLMGCGGLSQPPELGNWKSMAAGPFIFSRACAVWTGTEMVAWGEGDIGCNKLPAGTPCQIGGRYDPVIDKWKDMASAPSEGRRNMSAIWTGREMLIWSGECNGGAGNICDGGAAYDPALDHWRAINDANAPLPRGKFVSVWTGNRMIVWGGRGADQVARNDGAAYDPEMDQWSPISANGAPSPRYEAVSAWTGKKLLIWGGISFLEYFTDGASYDAVTDKWTAMSAAGAPSGRLFSATAWTGTELVVWGGLADQGSLNDGSAYNPETDTWRPIAPAPNPPPKGSFVWTGTELVVWGLPGSRYSPATNTWSAMGTEGQPSLDRSLNVSLWTGKEMITWGGTNHPSTVLNDGARYTP